MMILLPDAIDGLKDLEANFSKLQFNEIVNNLHCYTVSVKLPRFKLEQSFELKDTLSKVSRQINNFQIKIIKYFVAWMSYNVYTRGKLF